MIPYYLLFNSGDSENVLDGITYTGSWYYTGWNSFFNLGKNFNSVKDKKDLCIALISDGTLKFKNGGNIDIYIVGGGGSGGYDVSESSGTIGVSGGASSVTINGTKYSANGGSPGDTAGSDYTSHGGNGGSGGGSVGASYYRQKIEGSWYYYVTFTTGAAGINGNNGGTVTGRGGQYSYYSKGQGAGTGRAFNTNSGKLFGSGGGYTAVGQYGEGASWKIGPYHNNGGSGGGFSQSSEIAGSKYQFADGISNRGGGGGSATKIYYHSISGGCLSAFAGGGGGGYTSLKSSVTVSKNNAAEIIIGQGGASVGSNTTVYSGKGGDGVVLIRVHTTEEVEPEKITWYRYSVVTKTGKKPVTRYIDGSSTTFTNFISSLGIPTPYVFIYEDVITYDTGSQIYKVDSGASGTYFKKLLQTDLLTFLTTAGEIRTNLFKNGGTSESTSNPKLGKDEVYYDFSVWADDDWSAVEHYLEDSGQSIVIDKDSEVIVEDYENAHDNGFEGYDGTYCWYTTSQK